MKLFSRVIFVLIILMIFSKHIESSSKNSNLKMLIIRNFGFGPVRTENLRLYDFIEKKIQKQRLTMQEKLRKQKEEEEEKAREAKRRKIINQYLMPLTKGNSFMRDFYTGRY